MNPSLPQTLQALDLARLIPAAPVGAATLALASGLLLWLFGGRLLRPLFAVLGAAAGGAIGSVASPALGIEFFPVLTAPQEGLLIGGLLGFLGALVLHRLAVALAGGVLAALVAVAATLACTLPQAALPVAAEPEVHVVLRVAIVDQFAPQEHSAAAGATAPAAQAGVAYLSRQWDALGVRLQAILILAAVAGGLVGVLFGLVGPRRASALLTALVGAAVTLASACVLADLVPLESLGRADAQRLLAIWVVMGVAGFAFQSFRVGTPVPRPAVAA